MLKKMFHFKDFISELFDKDSVCYVSAGVILLMSSEGFTKIPSFLALIRLATKWRRLMAGWWKVPPPAFVPHPHAVMEAASCSNFFSSPFTFSCLLLHRPTSSPWRGLCLYNLTFCHGSVAPLRTIRKVSRRKLDREGPVDNTPSTD